MDRYQPQDRGIGEDAILLVVTKGLPDFVQNVLASIERCNLSNCTICIALPRNALAEIQIATSAFRSVKYFFVEDICAADYSWIVEYQEYGSQAFGRFTASKWPAIRYLLNSGFRRVTYTDVDIAWIRNPIPLLKAALRTFELAIQTEGMDNFPPVYCTGFMSFRNSEFTIRLLNQLADMHAEMSKRNPKMHDQIVFNRFVSGSKGMVQRIFGLSELLFANGKIAGAMALQDDELAARLDGRVDPMIFHANWTIGIENKRWLLRRTGNWLIDH